MKRLSIIIITYNGLGFLTRCLDSLHTFVNDPTCEVIIIDNYSTDGTLDFLRENYPQLLGNEDDAEVIENGINAYSEAYEPEYESVDYYKKLVDKDGIPQDSCKPYPGLMIKVRNVLGIGNKMRYTPNAEGVIEPIYVIGACQMFWRKVVDKVGMLDEHIFYGPEDADWCIRIKQAGWKTHCLNNYTIMHDYRRSTRRSPFSRLGRLHMKALLYFYWKHKKLF